MSLLKMCTNERTNSVIPFKLNKKNKNLVKRKEYYIYIYKNYSRLFQFVSSNDYLLYKLIDWIISFKMLEKKERKKEYKHD